MANPEHLAILKQGVKVWNAWRRNNADVMPNLDSHDLNGTILSGVNFFGADLSYVKFKGTDLTRADLRNAFINNADLSNANLSDANLALSQISETDLAQANLSNADLSHTYILDSDLENANFENANFNGAALRISNLLGANFSRAHLQWTVFADVDLSTVRCLETVIHSGPSTIGIDTIARSRGEIPEVFLRGCGVPDTFITYARSLTGKAFEFYSSFISHSTKDKRFCERLYADLQAKAVRVWYFPEDAKWGETVWGEIDSSIKIYDKLIVVCSGNSLQSVPVQREIERALNREDKEGKGILFPIRIDDYIFNTWEHPRKADVLAKVVGDFSGWEHDAAKYEKAFDKLLKGLQAEEKK